MKSNSKKIMPAMPLLEVKNLKTYFPVRSGVFGRKYGYVHAVDDISFNIKHGETLGLVGESGCGKTTVGRSIAKLYEDTSGAIIFDGKNILTLRGKQLRKIRRNIGIIFQDPFESLNPRQTVYDILEEPFIIHKIKNKKERKNAILQLINKVGMPEEFLNRFPHQFSGGQRQRIAIARAIALKPKFIICDEPVSALDVSIQSQILNLLINLGKQMNLTLLFISHALAVVRHISDYTAVMYLGKIVEITDADRICASPVHPYTKALISAAPLLSAAEKKQRIILKGEVPSPINPPAGCRFHTRCPNVMAICKKVEPKLKPISETTKHLAACYLI